MLQHGVATKQLRVSSAAFGRVPRLTLGRLLKYLAMGPLALLVCMSVSVSAHAQTMEPADELVRRIKACTSCHGDKGQGSAGGYYPRIAGKPALYLYRQLQNFQNGLRTNPMMQHMVDGLSDAYLHEIANHFAALHPPQAIAVEPQGRASGPLLARGRQLVRYGDPQRNLPACQACHGQRLTGVEPGIPALIGLPADYISAQLGAWRSGIRAAPDPDCMAEVANRLGVQDTRAVAVWLASQPLPADPAPMPAGTIESPLACGSAGR